MAAGPISERNQDATIYVGGLDEKVSFYSFIIVFNLIIVEMYFGSVQVVEKLLLQSFCHWLDCSYDDGPFETLSTVLYISNFPGSKIKIYFFRKLLKCE